jgi:hypothetical protein
LQRDAFRSRGDKVSIPAKEVVSHVVEQCEPTTAGAGRIRGKFLGISTGRADTGFRQRRSRIVDGVT